MALYERKINWPCSTMHGSLGLTEQIGEYKLVLIPAEHETTSISILLRVLQRDLISLLFD